MSCVFIVTTAVIVNPALLGAAITAVAGTLGFKALNKDKQFATEQPADKWVEISMNGSQIIGDTMKRESEFTIRRDDVTATFKREADGRCIVHISGKNKSENELQTIGQELVGRVTQQYAYNKVMSEMKNRGFTVTNEEVTADNTIKINISKYV
jgi:hypothetical protein